MLKNVLKKLGQHSFIYGIGIFVSKAAGFLMIPIYTTHLSPAEYGIIGVLDFTASVISGIIGLRVGNAIVFFYHAADNEQQKLSVISTGMIFLFLFASGISFILSLFSFDLSNIIFDTREYASYFIIMLISMTLQIAIEPGMVYLRLLEKSTLFTAISIVKLIIAVCLNVYFIVFLKIGVLGMLYSELITSFFTVFFCGYWVFKRTGFRISISSLKEMVKYSMPLIPAALCMTILHSADTFILSLLAGVYSVGIYTLGYKFGMILSNVILMPFALIWSTLVYKIVKEINGKTTIAKVCTAFCAVMVWTALLIGLFVDDAIRLMADQQYWIANKAVPYILLGYVFFGISSIFHFGSLYKKKTSYTLFANAIAACTNLILNFIVIPMVEIKFLGAAITTTISFFILAGCRLMYSNRVFPIHYELRKMTYLCLSGIFFFLLGITITFQEAYLNWGFKLSLVLLFPVPWMFFGVISKEDIKSVYHSIRMKYFRRTICTL